MSNPNIIKRPRQTGEEDDASPSNPELQETLETLGMVIGHLRGTHVSTLLDSIVNVPETESHNGVVERFKAPDEDEIVEILRQVESIASSVLVGTQTDPLVVDYGRSRLIQAALPHIGFRDVEEIGGNKRMKVFTNPGKGRMEVTFTDAEPDLATFQFYPLADQTVVQPTVPAV